MKKVKIEIYVEVSDECKFVSVDEDGRINLSFGEKMHWNNSDRVGYWCCMSHGIKCVDKSLSYGRVSNWKSTQRKVKSSNRRKKDGER